MVAKPRSTKSAANGLGPFEQQLLQFYRDMRPKVLQLRDELYEAVAEIVGVDRANEMMRQGPDARVMQDAQDLRRAQLMVQKLAASVDAFMLAMVDADAVQVKRLTTLRLDAQKKLARIIREGANQAFPGLNAAGEFLTAGGIASLAEVAQRLQALVGLIGLGLESMEVTHDGDFRLTMASEAGNEPASVILIDHATNVARFDGLTLEDMQDQFDTAHAEVMRLEAQQVAPSAPDMVEVMAPVMPSAPELEPIPAAEKVVPSAPPKSAVESTRLPEDMPVERLVAPTPVEEASAGVRQVDLALTDVAELLAQSINRRAALADRFAMAMTVGSLVNSVFGRALPSVEDSVMHSMRMAAVSSPRAQSLTDLYLQLKNWPSSTASFPPPSSTPFLLQRLGGSGRGFEFDGLIFT